MVYFNNTIATWSAWNSIITTTNSIITTTNSSPSTFGGTGSALVWPIWNVSAGSAATTNNLTVSASQVWNVWNSLNALARQTQPVNHGQLFQAQAPAVIGLRQPTPEELRREYDERRAADAAYQERARQAEAQRAQAASRAEKLLVECLTPAQREEFLKTKRFYTMVEGRRYRIDYGSHGNVHMVDDKDAVLESYCIQPNAYLPHADAMLAQKLLLETDIRSFKRIANVTRRGI